MTRPRNVLCFGLFHRFTDTNAIKVNIGATAICNYHYHVRCLCFSMDDLFSLIVKDLSLPNPKHCQERRAMENVRTLGLFKSTSRGHPPGLAMENLTFYDGQMKIKQ
jgi:hypothetical protein